MSRINIKHQLEKAPTGLPYIPVTEPANGELRYKSVADLFAENSTTSGILHQTVLSADVSPLTDTEIDNGFVTVTAERPFVDAYPSFIVAYLNGIMTSGLGCIPDTPLDGEADFVITVTNLGMYANTDWNVELIIQWTKVTGV